MKTTKPTLNGRLRIGDDAYLRQDVVLEERPLGGGAARRTVLKAGRTMVKIHHIDEMGQAWVRPQGYQDYFPISVSSLSANAGGSFSTKGFK